MQAVSVSLIMLDNEEYFEFESDEIDNVSIKMITGDLIHSSKVQMVITLEDSAMLVKSPLDFEEVEPGEDEEDV